MGRSGLSSSPPPDASAALSTISSSDTAPMTARTVTIGDRFFGGGPVCTDAGWSGAATQSPGSAYRSAAGRPLRRVLHPIGMVEVGGQPTDRRVLLLRIGQAEALAQRGDDLMLRVEVRRQPVEPVGDAIELRQRPQGVGRAAVVQVAAG